MELPFQFSETQQIKRPQQSEECSNANSAKPQCLIPFRQNLDCKPCAWVAPRTAARCALHFEGVAARRQRRVAGCPPVATHFVPSIVEPDQPIAVTIRLCIKKAQ